MSGIFLACSKENINIKNIFASISKDSISRGCNSSVLLKSSDLKNYHLFKSNTVFNNLNSKISAKDKILIGYTGLNAENVDEVPVLEKNKIVLFHDGIIINAPLDKTTLYKTTPTNTKTLFDNIINKMNEGLHVKDVAQDVLDTLKGTINCILFDPTRGTVTLFSNHGSLYYFNDDTTLLVASEESIIKKHGFAPKQVKGVVHFNVFNEQPCINFETHNVFKNKESFSIINNDINILEYKIHTLKRCTRCVLPETMPFIKFDEIGVCNYCNNYKSVYKNKNNSDLLHLIEPYRKDNGYDCIIPFSGGRDSCYSLYIAKEKLKLNPVAYTYDWGMVTDVGHRNISLMCGELGVENIIIADNIQKKRKNIAMNFSAWLKNPDLGMLNILTAGDKHFFRHINTVKQQTGVKLNLWGVNPLEVTHFKTGFLGISPDFEKQKVYASGLISQLHYNSKRFKRMLKSPGYFNTSLWDTYTGEFYRSYVKKTDYFHVFDYWKWSESEINNFLKNYNWEKAADTSSTWRIGDGTAGIFNYINYTLAGFTESDTFRSNQIREGEITRNEALKLLEVENAPWYDNLRWYLSAIGFDFADTIKTINKAKRKHELLY